MTTSMYALLAKLLEDDNDAKDANLHNDLRHI